MDIKLLVSILLAGIFTNNYIFKQTKGICPFLGVSKKYDQAAGMGVAVTFVMLVAAAVTYPIQKFILDEFDLGYLQTIVFILVIAALVQFVEIILKKFIPALYKSLGVYLPLITTNCAVLGIALENVKTPIEIGNVDLEEGYNFIQAMVSALGAGLGFLLAMVLFVGVRARIENSPAPKAFKGLPVTLIAAGILAMVFSVLGDVASGILAIWA